MSTNRNYLVFVDNIADSLQAIQDYSREVSFSDFSSNQLMQDAINMRLQVIGENANKIPVELLDQFPKLLGTN